MNKRLVCHLLNNTIDHYNYIYLIRVYSGSFLQQTKRKNNHIFFNLKMKHHFS